MQKNSKPLSIREANRSDSEAILATQLKAFKIYTKLFSASQIPPLNESIEQIQNDFKHKIILIACMEDSIVGSIRYTVNLGVCHLERLSVNPDYQNQGIGHKLVREVETMVAGKAHKITLETGLLASELVKFYSRLGYSGEAILKNHYGNFDWIVFSKFL